jgi:hypothetical protein
VLVTRASGFGGVYLGDHMNAGSSLDSVARAVTFVSDHWRKLAREYCFGAPHYGAEDRRK